MSDRKEQGKLHIFLNGVLRENPVLILLLGTCPTLAVTTQASNGVGMGLAATFVLLGSNIVISLLKNIIPDKVRIPCYIVVIAGFVTLVSMIIEAYFPDLYTALGVFLQLIVVNCIILGRAEMFASKRPLVDSILDALGMGLGFTIVLLIMGSIRELIGNGTFFGITVTAEFIAPATILKMAPGGFFIFGLLIAVTNMINRKLDADANIRSNVACATCPAAAAGCPSAEAITTAETVADKEAEKRSEGGDQA